jgi:chromosome segregation ATPase
LILIFLASTLSRERDNLKLRLTLTEEKSKQQEKELQDLTQQLLTIQKQFQDLTVDIQGVQVFILIDL